MSGLVERRACENRLSQNGASAGALGIFNTGTVWPWRFPIVRESNPKTTLER